MIKICKGCGKEFDPSSLNPEEADWLCQDCNASYRDVSWRKALCVEMDQKLSLKDWFSFWRPVLVCILISVVLSLLITWILYPYL